MDLKKRKEYLILTIVSFGMGFAIFGGMIAANKELLGITLHIFVALLIYGLEGGLLIGGLFSGIFLFSTTIYLWLITLTASKELSILLLKLYNDGAIGMSASFLGLRVRNLD